MTRKKRRGPTLEEEIDRPWCYYCERDFDDMGILLSHQKAKHFKCDKCGRRLNTAGGLSVHMNQVHKEPLERVENALPNRIDPNSEIFGTEGIPEEATRDHVQRVVEQYHQNAADRFALTGNLQPGAKEKAPKRPKLVEQGDLKQRLKEYAAAKAAGQPRDYEMQDVNAPHGYQQPYASGAGAYQQPPPGQSAYGFTPPAASPSQSMGVGQAPGQLPQRPPVGAPPGAWQQPPSQDPRSLSQPQNVPPMPSRPDHTMPDAPPPAVEEATKKVKKEKGIKMVYQDGEVSPEEKMARMAKYAFNPAEHEPVILGGTTGEVAGTVQE